MHATGQRAPVPTFRPVLDAQGCAYGNLASRSRVVAACMDEGVQRSNLPGCTSTAHAVTSDAEPRRRTMLGTACHPLSAVRRYHPADG